MKVIELVVRTVRKFIAKDTFTLGAALAYYTAFSLAPLLLIAVAIAGVVFGDEAAEGRLSQELKSSVGPAVADAIQSTLSAARASASTSTATLVGFVVLLFGAAGVFGQLQTSLNTIWEVPPKTSGGILGWIKSRFLSFTMVLGTGLLLLILLAASTGLTALGDRLLQGDAHVAQSANHALSFAMLTMVFAVIFKVLPDCEVAWSNVWVGAAVTAGLFTLGKYLLGLYFAHFSVGSPYGAAGSLAVILVWDFYASLILLLGAQFTQVFSEIRFEQGDTPSARSGDRRTALHGSRS